MINMKAYTDLEQSKKLVEILPIESADMHYATWTILDGEFIVSPNQGDTIENLQEDYGNQIIPCWSLAALLDVLPSGKALIHDKGSHGYKCICKNIDSYLYDNPIDACYKMIIKLRELKML